MNSANKGTAALNRTHKILKSKKDIIKLSLSACMHCSLCAESCFKYISSGKDPEYTPSYKMINSTGRIYRKRGRLTDDEYMKIKELVFDRCVLCMRCRCPLGIDIPLLISIARSVCRENGLYRSYDEFAEPRQI